MQRWQLASTLIHCILPRIICPMAFLQNWSNSSWALTMSFYIFLNCGLWLWISHMTAASSFYLAWYVHINHTCSIIQVSFFITQLSGINIPTACRGQNWKFKVGTENMLKQDCTTWLKLIIYQFYFILAIFRKSIIPIFSVHSVNFAALKPHEMKNRLEKP